MEETELTDIWRSHHPDAATYTWHRKRPSPIFCRLDYFLVSYGITQNIASSSIAPGFRSDHSLVSLNFIPVKCIRGKGFWKLNCSHLKEIGYVNLIKSVIKSICEINVNATLDILWDVVKTVVRGESIKYGSKIKKKTEDKMRSLENELQTLENRLSNNSAENVAIAQEIDIKKEQWSTLIKKKTQGVIVRSRIQWYEEGETNSKYFFNLEKRTSNMKSINRLQITGDIITDNPERILQEMKNFYQALYSSVNTNDVDRYFESTAEPQIIKDSDYARMGRDITETELLNTIKSLPNNKTPGEDGLPAEFYKIFWVDIKSILLNSYKYLYEKGHLSITQKRGLLCLIPKKPDPLFLKNWRPLSLLNQDYKILAKLIAERIKLVLPYLIDEDQTGFLKGRYIGQNIVIIFDIIHHTDVENIPAVMISIDFEKAFDKLEWNFVFKCLEFFKFPPYIKDWVKILYTDIKSSVTNNGWHTEYFNLGRGVRQGCPLSPYLFILCAEILAMQTRNNNKITGIQMGNKTYKIMQYADDTQLFSMLNFESLQAILITFGEYSAVSGLKINFDKSEVLKIGSARKNDDFIETNPSLHWSIKPLNVLGILVTPELEKVVNMNITPVVQKIVNIIKYGVNEN